MFFSVIIPVYNRPDEIDELLNSLTSQTYKNFEVLVVEDGSNNTCKHITEKYNSSLSIRYFYKENEKPAIARNYGMSKASGDYFLFFDSDCILPAHYFETVIGELKIDYADAFGGPDKAHSSFSNVQKAINFSMTSLFTTGGIRGKTEKVDKFFPRSFNMGISRKIYKNKLVFPVTAMHPGEDMVFAIEIIKRGFSTRLIKNAFVYHKRRTSFAQFAKQVFRFGKTRLLISKIYPNTFKIFFTFPSLFSFFTVIMILTGILFCLYAFIPVLFFILFFFIASLIETRNIVVSFLSIISSFIQLFGYGLGFFVTAVKVFLLGKDEYSIFNNTFY